MYIALLVKARGNEFFHALTLLHTILDFLSSVRLNCRYPCSKQLSENQILI